jgi:ElaB/YqjD/DUF883 family membrane-anchored ribosome-binding protein
MAMHVATEDLTADLRALVAEMEALLQEGGDALKERLGEAGDTLEADLAQARKRLASLQRHTGARLRRAAGYVERYARDKPWQTNAASLGLGLVLGLALGLAVRGRDS